MNPDIQKILVNEFHAGERVGQLDEALLAAILLELRKNTAILARHLALAESHQ